MRFDERVEIGHRRPAAGTERPVGQRPHRVATRQIAVDVRQRAERRLRVRRLPPVAGRSDLASDPADRRRRGLGLPATPSRIHRSADKPPSAAWYRRLPPTGERSARTTPDNSQLEPQRRSTRGQPSDRNRSMDLFPLRQAAPAPAPTSHRHGKMSSNRTNKAPDLGDRGLYRLIGCGNSRSVVGRGRPLSASCSRSWARHRKSARSRKRSWQRSGLAGEQADQRAECRRTLRKPVRNRKRARRHKPAQHASGLAAGALGSAVGSQASQQTNARSAAGLFASRFASGLGATSGLSTTSGLGTTSGLAPQAGSQQARLAAQWARKRANRPTRGAPQDLRKPVRNRKRARRHKRAQHRKRARSRRSWRRSGLAGEPTGPRAAHSRCRRPRLHSHKPAQPLPHNHNLVPWFVQTVRPWHSKC